MRVSGVPRRGGGHHPVGDAECGPIRLSFDPQLRVEFRGATVTSDAGLLLPRVLKMDIKVNGEVVGAIGLSGAPTVQNDVDCASAALALVSDAVPGGRR